MDIELIIRCDSSTELVLVAAVLESVETVLAEVAAEDAGATDVTAPPETEKADIPDPVSVTPEPKKRGRPKRAKPDEVKGAAVLEQLKESVAVAPEPSSNVVPMKKADPIADAVFGVPDTAPVEVGAITTGQQLQEYILGLVHQKRLDPVAVKAKVYPKYGVVRSLDLTAEQVPQAKADVDAMLKGSEPKKAANDLDL